MSLDSSTVVRKNWQSQQIGAVVVVNSGSAEGAREILPRRRERRGGASVMSSLIRWAMIVESDKRLFTWNAAHHYC
jgi:hypothetical protein